MTLLVSEPSALIVVSAIAWPMLTLGSAAGIFVSGSPLRVATSVFCSASLPGRSAVLFFAVGSTYSQPPGFLIATIA